MTCLTLPQKKSVVNVIFLFVPFKTAHVFMAVCVNAQLWIICYTENFLRFFFIVTTFDASHFGWWGCLFLMTEEIIITEVVFHYNSPLLYEKFRQWHIFGKPFSALTIIHLYTILTFSNNHISWHSFIYRKKFITCWNAISTLLRHTHCVLFLWNIYLQKVYFTMKLRNRLILR